jgi:hypothetical protein
MSGQSERECDQCTATSKSGNRCRNRTCRGKLCWQHLKRDSGLRVKSSQIAAAGMGLWTTRRFKPNEKIGNYTGERITKQQMLARYPNNKRGEYVLCPNNGYCIDGKKTNSSSIRFANDSKGNSQLKNNAVFKQGSDVLRAGPQGIPANREIFVSYGSDYWKGVP